MKEDHTIEILISGCGFLGLFFLLTCICMNVACPFFQCCILCIPYLSINMPVLNCSMACFSAMDAHTFVVNLSGTETMQLKL